MKDKDFKNLLKSIDQARRIHRLNKVLREIESLMPYIIIVFLFFLGFILAINQSMGI